MDKRERRFLLNFIDELRQENRSLIQENRSLKQELKEAAYYVEQEICLRTHFSGEYPYVGWKGLGLAMVEHMDMLKTQRDTVLYFEEKNSKI